MNIEWKAVLFVAVVLIAWMVVAIWQEWADWAGYIAAVLGVALLILVICAGAFSANRRSCRIFADINNYSRYYSIATGCLIEVEPGRWLDPALIYTKTEDIPR